RKIPKIFDAVLGCFDIMQESIIREKRLASPPDIYIHPDLHGIELLDFYRANQIYEQAEAAGDELRSALEAALKR
ncbi:MAG: patatin-like phospholipase family protein, partial [Verrucomicrobiota bacterium]